MNVLPPVGVSPMLYSTDMEEQRAYFSEEAYAKRGTLLETEAPAASEPEERRTRRKKKLSEKTIARRRGDKELEELLGPFDNEGPSQ